MTNTTCSSCSFPVGARTGEIHPYVWDGQALSLCDDCVSHWHDVTDDAGNLYALPVRAD